MLNVCVFEPSSFRFTGYSTMKIGKTAAFLIGGGIIFLEVANEQGWIRIDCTLFDCIFTICIIIL